jgi:glutaryl-CoA dehydrogenase
MANRHERFDEEIMLEIGDFGLLGATIPTEYGGAGVNYVSYGLAAREIERVDSGYRSAMSVQPLARDAPDPCLWNRDAAPEVSAEAGAWGADPAASASPSPTTAPTAGGMHSRAEPGGYLVTGNKMWITNSPIAHIFIAWAKVEGVTLLRASCLNNAPLRPAHVACGSGKVLRQTFTAVGPVSPSAWT